MNYLSLDEVKKIELDILIQFEQFCKRERLYYVLCGGTLLGAIRHKGFIPWDDDIDVTMPRKDYNRFLELFGSNQSECNFLSLLKPGDVGYYYPFAKLYDNRTVAQMEDNDSKHGIWIDIFPADDLPENKEDLKDLFKKTRFWRAVVISMTTNLSGERSLRKKALKAILMAFANIIGKEKIVKKANMISQMYNGTDSKFLGVSIWGYGPGERMSKKEFYTQTSVEFEKQLFNAPECWDDYLSGLYGDYMKLPPVEKRKTHHLKAWKKCD